MGSKIVQFRGLVFSTEPLQINGQLSFFTFITDTRECYVYSHIKEITSG